jgi:hypothetical protein
MPQKKQRRPKARAKKITPVTATIIAAIIAAVGGISAALIEAYGHNSPEASQGPSASQDPDSPSASPARTPTSTSGASPAPSTTRPETDEYAVTGYTDYAGPTGAEISINPGQVVYVYCRIPGDSNTPSSVGSAGWYKIASSNKIIYAAANAFYNDPGNGLGMTPNQRSYDPGVPIC